MNDQDRRIQVAIVTTFLLLGVIAFYFLYNQKAVIQPTCQELSYMGEYPIRRCK